MLNLGGRWDYVGWPWDTNDRVATFDPTVVPASCIANGGGNCIDQGFVAPAGTPSFGTPNVSPSTQEQQRLKNFAPRLGFAFDPFGNGKMAVRGGYGIFYIRTSGQTVLQPISSPPWVEQYLASGTAIVGSGVLANPWPAGLPQPSAFPVLPQIGQFSGYTSAGVPIFLNSSGQPAVSQALYGFTRNLRIPYVQQWNTSVQYEVLRGWVVEVGYIGSHGVGLLVEPSLNQAYLVNAANPGIGGLTVNSNNNATIRVPIPGFAPAGLNLVTNQGMSSYNAAILEVRHDFAHSFQFRMDYTYSKSIDNDSGPTGSDLDSFYGNQLVPFLDRAQSDFNDPNRLVFTYVWQIPGAKNGWIHAISNGWGLSGVWTLQSGFPFSVTSTSGGSLFGVNGSVNIPAIVNSSCSGGYTQSGAVQNNLNDWINPSCFSALPTLSNGTVLTGLNSIGGSGTQSYTVGGAVAGDTSGATLFGFGARNILRGPFEQRFDLALTRDFHIRESMTLQLRVEAFKLFNNVIFANPSANISNYNSNPALNNFGVYTSTVDSTGRILQFAAKLNF